MKELRVTLLYCSIYNNIRRILTIWWPDRISEEDLGKETDQLPIHIEIRKHEWKWIRPTLRTIDITIEKYAL